MPSPYAELITRTMSLVDDKFAEEFEIYPRTAGDSRNLAGPDSEREVHAFTGILRRNLGYTDRGTNKGMQWGGDMDADHAILSVQPSEMPDYKVKKGDQIRAIDRNDDLYEVHSADTGHAGRVRIRVTPLD